MVCVCERERDHRQTEKRSNVPSFSEMSEFMVKSALEVKKKAGT